MAVDGIMLSQPFHGSVDNIASMLLDITIAQSYRTSAGNREQRHANHPSPQRELEAEAGLWGWWCSSTAILSPTATAHHVRLKRAWVRHAEAALATVI
jgi:hypothetical protein